MNLMLLFWNKNLFKKIMLTGYSFLLSFKMILICNDLILLKSLINEFVINKLSITNAKSI